MLPNQDAQAARDEAGLAGFLFVKWYVFISSPDAPFHLSTKKHG